MYPDRAILQHVIKAWWKVACQKAGKPPPGPASFLFRERMNKQTQTRSLTLKSHDFKQLLDEVFVISRLIKVEVGVIG